MSIYHSFVTGLDNLQPMLWSATPEVKIFRVYDFLDCENSSINATMKFEQNNLCAQLWIGQTCVKL